MFPFKHSFHRLNCSLRDIIFLPFKFKYVSWRDRHIAIICPQLAFATIFNSCKSKIHTAKSRACSHYVRLIVINISQSGAPNKLVFLPSRGGSGFSWKLTNVAVQNFLLDNIQLFLSDVCKYREIGVSDISFDGNGISTPCQKCFHSLNSFDHCILNVDENRLFGFEYLWRAILCCVRCQRPYKGAEVKREPLFADRSLEL